MPAPTLEQHLALKRELQQVKTEAAAQVEAATQRAKQAKEDAAETIRRLEADHEAALERLAAELEDGPAGRRVAEAQARERQARQELQDVRAELQGLLAAERQQHAARQEQLASQFEAVRAQLEEATDAPARLRAELDQTRARVAELEGAVQAATEAAERHRRRVDVSAESRIAQMKRALSETGAAKRVAEAEQQEQAARDELAAATAEHAQIAAELQRRLTALRVGMGEQLNAIRGDLTRAQNDLAQSERDAAALRARVAELEKQAQPKPPPPSLYKLPQWQQDLVRAVGSLAREVPRTPDGVRQWAREFEALADAAEHHPDYPSRRREAAEDLRERAAELLAKAEKLDPAASEQVAQGDA